MAALVCANNLFVGISRNAEEWRIGEKERGKKSHVMAILAMEKGFYFSAIADERQNCNARV